MKTIMEKWRYECDNSGTDPFTDLPPPPPLNLPSKRWRNLILRVWHVDPLRCPVCQSPMRVISFSAAMVQISPVAKSGGPKFLHVHNFPVQYQPGWTVPKNTCTVRRSDTVRTMFRGVEDTA